METCSILYSGCITLLFKAIFWWNLQRHIWSKELFAFPPYKDTSSLSLASLISAFESFLKKKSIPCWKRSSFWNFGNATPLPIENILDMVSQPNKAWIACYYPIILHPKHIFHTLDSPLIFLPDMKKNIFLFTKWISKTGKPVSSPVTTVGF